VYPNVWPDHVLWDRLISLLSVVRGHFRSTI
jgi:hypothetical protein